MKKRERELLHSLLSTLPERHQFVLRTRYGLDPGDDAERTLQATADIVGISKQAIHRIEKEALQKLRELYERCRDDSTDPQEVIHMSD